MNALLGRPGDLVPRDGLVDAYITRIGGTPVLPAGADALPESSCPHCNQPLMLLLQTHAPVGGAQERFLYLLGCASNKCQGAWKALRCQPASPAAAASAEPASPTSASMGQRAPPSAHPELGAAAGDGWWKASDDAGEGDWGAGAAGWGPGGESGVGGWEEEAEDPACNGSTFDFDDLNAALDAVASKQSIQQAAAAPRPPGSSGAHPPRQPVAGADAGPGAAGGETPGSADPQGCYAGPCLPSFFLVAQSEAAQASQPKLAKKELLHLQQLLTQYEQETGASVPDVAAGCGAGAAAAGAACLPSVESGVESWVGEGYEPDAVLHADKARAAGLRPAFIKFAKRLGACPDQCARYSLGGMPLWPSEALPNPQPCARCGGPAAFELQLMAPAIHYLEESADWLEEESAEEKGPGPPAKSGTAAGAAAGSSILRPPPSWEWATVAVYSCSRSCRAAGAEGGSWAEEQVFVQNE